MFFADKNDKFLIFHVLVKKRILQLCLYKSYQLHIHLLYVLKSSVINFIPITALLVTLSIIVFVLTSTIFTAFGLPFLSIIPGTGVFISVFLP